MSGAKNRGQHPCPAEGPSRWGLALATVVVMAPGRAAAQMMGGSMPASGGYDQAASMSAASAAGSAGATQASGASAAPSVATMGGPEQTLGLKPTAAPRVLALSEALSLAVNANLDLKAASEKLNQASAQVRRALALFLPQLSAGGSYTYSIPETSVSFGSEDQFQQQALLYRSIAGMMDQSLMLISDPVVREETRAQAAALRSAADEIEGTSVEPIVIQPRHTWAGTVTLALPVFNGRSFPMYGTANTARDMAKASVEHARASLLHGVARTYYGAIVAKKVVAIASEQQRRATQHRDTVRRLLGLGTQTQLALERAELEVVRSEQQVRSASNALSLALGALGLLLDIDTVFDVVEPEPVRPVEEEATPDAFVERALAARQDLVAQKAALALAERTRDDAWMQFLPSLNLVGQLRYNSNTNGFMKDPWTGAVVGQVSLPLYDGGVRYAALRESAARIREEKLKLAQAEKRIASQVRGNVLDLAVKRQALAAARRARELALSAARSVTALYELGTVTNLDVLDANLAVFGAEVELTRAQFDLEQGRLGLAYVLGEFRPELAPPRS